MFACLFPLIYSLGARGEDLSGVMRSSASASVRVTAVLDFSNLFIIQRLFIYDSTRRSPPTASGSQLRLLQSLDRGGTAHIPVYLPGSHMLFPTCHTLTGPATDTPIIYDVGCRHAAWGASVTQHRAALSRRDREATAGA